MPQQKAYQTTASAALEGTNWSPVGSAQQYQGSVRNGMAARATR